MNALISFLFQFFIGHSLLNSKDKEIETENIQQDLTRDILDPAVECSRAIVDEIPETVTRIPELSILFLIFLSITRVL